MKKLVFVTQNKNKIDDAKKLLPDFEIEHVDFEIPEIQSLNAKEIIEHKLKSAHEKIKKPCFVMDASVYIHELNDFPGPLIKWFFESLGTEKLCEVTNHLKNSHCRWTNIIGYFDGKNEYFFEGTVNGKIVKSPVGDNGYAWDSIFIPDGSDKTFAQMTFEEKQSLAASKKVLDKFNTFLNS